RMRLPFSLNILAEEAALTALDDKHFREATLACVREGRKQLFDGLKALGCTVYPSRANFLMFTPPQGIEANEVYVGLLKKGVIVRALKSYEMPWNIRVSIGSSRENKLFLKGMRELLGKGA
ncbi:MAG: aminotransferase class I/II-fold pyridoxal phosphate-dependent enzyme, partial [Desulfovibrio sp.]|nr:aminotransferase class I/II-fold pyridoxal phosphate-dependent enzyme [Desulfovibrio sp.]